MSLLLLTMLSLQPAIPKLWPIAPWVAPLAISQDRADDSAAPLLLEDVQVLADKNLEVFHHRAWLARTLSGASELSNHEFQWDASYETLHIHGVWIWRNGVRSNAWHAEDAHVFQREARLTEGIYDGITTLRLELRDVRVGDIVEWAFTKQGENPVHQKHFSMNWWPAQEYPVATRSLKILWNRERVLQFKAHAAAKEPSTSPTSQGTLFELTESDIKAQEFEDDVPADIESVPFVEFSDWGSWKEVETWAAILFRAPQQGLRFQAAFKKFQRLPKHEQVKAMVRFVQDDIRYVGIEMGEHSHQPHSPEWVLEHGFGDCKDKARLLSALISASGVSAWPALVNSHEGSALAQQLPSALAFDHAIVRADFESGPTFLDATQTQRRGDPAKWESPEFGVALVLGAGAEGLEEIALPDKMKNTWEVHQHWSVPAQATHGKLEIRTIGRGAEASYLRNLVSRFSRAELTGNQRKGREKELRVKFTPEEFEWHDDEERDVFELVEKYSISEFLNEKLTHEFGALSIPRELVAPPEGERKFPLEAPRLRVKETLTYDAAQPLESTDFELDTQRVSHAAFELNTTRRVLGSELHLEWLLRSRANRIEVGEIASYRVAYEKAQQQLAYVVEPKRFHIPEPPTQTQAVTGDSTPLEFPKVPEVNLWPWTWALLALTVATTLVLSLGARQFAQKKIRASGPSAILLGSAPSSPLNIQSTEEAASFFHTSHCPHGHGWPSMLVVFDVLRVDIERISVVGRACSLCGAREQCYAKLPLPDSR
jgi:hypothetical protein